jgi:hypothetical protein
VPKIGSELECLKLGVQGLFKAYGYTIGFYFATDYTDFRRLGKSDWWITVVNKFQNTHQWFNKLQILFLEIFCNFIPLIGGIWLLVLMLTDSDPDENKYGPNPKKTVLINKPWFKINYLKCGKRFIPQLRWEDLENVH